MVLLMTNNASVVFQSGHEELLDIDMLVSQLDNQRVVILTKETLGVCLNNAFLNTSDSDNMTHCLKQCWKYVNM